MPQSLSQTVRNTFNKGLITEFSELNFPNEASVDELNCSLHKAGNRTKRLAVGYETGYELTTDIYAEGTLFHTGTWQNVGNNADTEYLVVQAGSTLRFFRKGNTSLSTNAVPISDSVSTPYTVDLTAYEHAYSLGAETSSVDVASINGVLVVVSPQIDAFYIEQDTSDHSFTETQIDFKVRDFDWLGVVENYDVDRGSPTTERKYDTYNCGWTSDTLSAYQSSKSKWPRLTHPWFSGKDASNNFSVSEFDKIYGGSSLIANGHFILDLFDKDRETASGIIGINSLAPADLTTRFNCVATYAGRVFFSGVDSKIYFSQIFDDTKSIGRLYQANDPTSEYFSDLLDTDGGYVRIPDAQGIKKLHVFGSSLLVMADNGVWRISGVDDVFRATEYSVFRVSEIGLAARRSFVSGTNGQPFWWSYIGIHTVQVTDQGGFIEVNISEDSIKTFWNSIDSSAKVSAVGEFDSFNNSVLWLYPDNEETVSYKLNRVLILDTELGAFYPWKVSDKTTGTSYIVGTSFYDGSGSATTAYNVISGSGDTVIDTSLDEVIVNRELGTLSSLAIKLLVRDSTGKLTFGEFSGNGFLDWGTEDYSSYLECAYNFIGDLSRRKNSPFITVFLKMAEEGWIADGSGYSPIRESSLKVSSYWDFKKTVSSTAQEAYRYKYPLIVDPGDLGTFDYPNTVLSTRLKLRGRGRVVRLRFEGSVGKDFNLLGYETIDAANNFF